MDAMDTYSAINDISTNNDDLSIRILGLDAAQYDGCFHYVWTTAAHLLYKMKKAIHNCYCSGQYVLIPINNTPRPQDDQQCFSFTVMLDIRDIDESLSNCHAFKMVIPILKMLLANCYEDNRYDVLIRRQARITGVLLKDGTIIPTVSLYVENKYYRNIENISIKRGCDTFKEKYDVNTLNFIDFLQDWDVCLDFVKMNVLEASTLLRRSDIKFDSLNGDITKL